MGCGSTFTAISTGGLSEAGTIAGEITGTAAQTEAAQQAAATQAGAATAGISEQKRQFDAITRMMSPYLAAGRAGLLKQQQLLGLKGPEQQDILIRSLERSPQYEALVRSGEEALLQRASATGGLRGGNVQEALAQYRPQILSNLIESQYAKYGGLSGQGQAAAAQQAGFGQNISSNIANLLQQRGAATAGGQLAAGSEQAQTFQNILGVGGLAAGFF